MIWEWNVIMVLAMWKCTGYHRVYSFIRLNRAMNTWLTVLVNLFSCFLLYDWFIDSTGLIRFDSIRFPYWLDSLDSLLTQCPFTTVLGQIHHLFRPNPPKRALQIHYFLTRIFAYFIFSRNTQPRHPLFFNFTSCTSRDDMDWRNVASFCDGLSNLCVGHL